MARLTDTWLSSLKVYDNLQQILQYLPHHNKSHILQLHKTLLSSRGIQYQYTVTYSCNAIFIHVKPYTVPTSYY